MLVRLLLFASLLLPLCASAQSDVEKVQAALNKLLNSGHKIYELRPGSEPLTDEWSKIIGHKPVNCFGDLCLEERYGLVHNETRDTLYASFREIEEFYGKIFLSGDYWACLVDEKLRVTNAFWRGQALSKYHLAVSKGPHSYGVIDSAAREVIPFKYDSIQMVYTWSGEDDMTPDFIVKNHGKWGVVSYKDKVLMKAEYESLLQLDGFAGFAGKKGKYAFVRSDSLPITPFVYDSMYTDFSIRNFIVTKNNKLGLMDIRGKEIMKPSVSTLTKATTFGCRCATVNGKYAVISGSGVNLTGFVFDDFARYDLMHDEIQLKKNGKWGFYGCRSKKELSPFVYDKVVAFYAYKADVIQNGVKKTINLDDDK